MSNLETESLATPAPDEFGFIKTMNNQGFMIDYLDCFSEEFVKFSPNAPGPVLDIGAAYGVASLEALRCGASVIANDIDPRHLKIIADQVKSCFSIEKQKYYQEMLGHFPSDLKISPNTLGAVLASRVFHFFDGEQIELGIETVFKWLKPGGRFYLISETPYVGGMSSFIPIYEDRIVRGYKWPGFIADFQSFDPVRGKDLPKQMHLLDEVVLKRTFLKYGFHVLRAEKFPRPKFPINLKLDGRESVGIIGVKI